MTELWEKLMRWFSGASAGSTTPDTDGAGKGLRREVGQPRSRSAPAPSPAHHAPFVAADGIAHDLTPAHEKAASEKRDEAVDARLDHYKYAVEVLRRQQPAHEAEGERRR